MSKISKIFIGAAVFVVLLTLAYRFASYAVKSKVAQQLSENYGLEHKGITVSLWNGSIAVDSLSGINEKGSISDVKVLDLNWFSLYRNNTVELKNLCMELENISTWTKDGKHQLKIRNVVKRNAHLYLENLSLESPLEVEEFMKDAEFRKPRFGVFIPRLDAYGITDSPVHINQVKIKNARIVLSEDLNLPMPEKKKKLLVQLIREIGTSFLIDSLQFTNSNLQYSVKDKGSSTRGDLTFNDLNLTMSNVTNDSLAITRDNTMILEMKSSIENDGNLVFITKHFLDSPTYQYDVYAQLTNFQLSKTNEVVSAAKNVKIKDGRINSLKMNGSFHDLSCDGEIEIDYENFQVALNKNFTGIASLIANSVIKKDGIEKVSFSSPRTVNQSFLVHVWQSVIESLRKLALVSLY